MLNHLVTRTIAIQWEAVIVIGLGIWIIINVADTDIKFHGNYVGKLIEICHKNNQSDECNEFREHLGVPMTAQIELGDKYWKELNEEPIWIGLTMFGFRIGTALLLHFQTVYKIRPFTIMMAILYGIIGAVLFYFGLVDTLYYILQGKEIPSQLPWLDGVGIFQTTKEWYGDPLHVDLKDLMIANMIGISIIGIFIFSAMLTMYFSRSTRAIA